MERTRVWLVIRDTVDGVYVFASEADARAYVAALDVEAVVSELPLIDRELAAQMIAEAREDT